jgi:hypothetical protein
MFLRTAPAVRAAMILASLWLSSCGSTDKQAAPDAATSREKRTNAAISLNEGETVNVTGLLGTVTKNDGLDVQQMDSGIAFHAPYGTSGQKTIEIDAPNAIVIQPIDVIAAKWSSIPKFDAGPEEREHGAVMLDEPNRRVILIGGSGYKPYGTPLADIWAYSLDSKTWSKPDVTGDIPPAAGSRRVAGNLLFGGYAEGSAVNNDLYRVELTNPIKFTKLTTTIPARSLHAFVKNYDRYFVFGGASTKPLNDTWEMKEDGTATQIAATGPSARYGFFFGADDQRMIVFSGAQSFSTVKPAEDTWAFDYATKTWSLLTLEGQPKGRRNGCFVFDAKDHRLFVFGGTADAMTTEAGFSVLDARVGQEKWLTLTRAGEPPLRSSGFGFWDPKTHSATCGFGNTTMGIFADWHTFGPT